MKVVHTGGVEVGGQRHRVILEDDDGFTREGSSFRVDPAPLQAALALIEDLQTTIETLQTTIADLESRVATLEEPA